MNNICFISNKACNQYCPLFNKVCDKNCSLTEISSLIDRISNVETAVEDINEKISDITDKNLL